MEHGITFTKIRFKNFLSYGNIWTEVALDVEGTTLLIGENLDTGGSSGAGKSTLINAIAYCLYDKIPSKVSKDRLINRTNDKKNTRMEIQLFFTKGVDEYEVHRWRGSETGVKMLLNGADVTPASVNRGEDSFNAKVEDVVGFSYNLFTQIILFNGNSEMFLDLSVGAQRQLIEELFKTTLLTKKANALKKESSETDKSISMQKLLIQQQEKQRELKIKHVNDAKARVDSWSQQYVIRVTNLEAEIERLSKIDYDGEAEVLTSLSDMQNKIVSLQGKIREIQVVKSAKDREKFPKLAQITIFNNDIKKLVSEKQKTESELVHLREAKCPYCLQKFEDAQAKISELEQRSQELDVEISLVQEKFDDLVEENKQFELQKSEEIEKIKVDEANYSQQFTVESLELKSITENLSFKTLSELHASKSQLTAKQDQMVALLNEQNPHVDAWVNLSQEEDVKVDTETLDKLITYYEHQQFLVKLLTDKNSFIRKNILSKTIPFLNKRIAYYTEKLNLPHVVVFQPDMSCEISEIGRELDHGNLSNGEKKRLNLSLCLSFRDVLTYLHSKVNVLFTDEIDGGSISGPDADALVSMIKSKAWDDVISIYVISHRPEFDGRCDRNLVIRKDGGFSTLIEQPDE
jgi:DNA repair exonuclease SbcCD ATPase subunit